MTATKNGADTAPIAGVDRRTLIPKLGLTEYWYPAIAQNKVGWKKPVYLKLLGQDVALFRGKSGDVAAVSDVCPHRGAMLSHGDCTFRGYITCFYHGFTYDENGECVAAIGEGPESKMPGNLRVRKYPTVTLKGFVFVWMGEREAVAPQEDIPEEFFDDDTMVFSWSNEWDCNWRPALENYADAHFRYLHRNAVRILFNPLPRPSPRGSRPGIVGKHRLRAFPDGAPAGGGRIPNISGRGGPAPYQDYYPGVDAKWPQSRWRLLWTWLFKWAEPRRTRRPFELSDEWQPGQHLPGMVRQNYWTHVFTRYVVPMAEEKSRLIYFHSARPSNWVGRLYERLHWTFIHNWMVNKNFSEQDARGAIEAYHDRPEYLSQTDLQTIAWRKFILTARGLETPQDVIEGGYQGEELVQPNAEAPVAAAADGTATRS